MENKVVLRVDIRAFAEMIAQMLRNEGIDAQVLSSSFFGGAYGVELGLLTSEGAEWRIVVPEDQEIMAQEVLEELEEIGELQTDLNEDDRQKKQVKKPAFKTFKNRKF